MKLYIILLIFSLVAALNASQSTLEKYTQLRNSTNVEKIETDRNSMIKMREDKREIRDYRDTIRDYRLAAIYAKVEQEHTPYR